MAFPNNFGCIISQFLQPKLILYSEKEIWIWDLAPLPPLPPPPPHSPLNIFEISNWLLLSAVDLLTWFGFTTYSHTHCTVLYYTVLYCTVLQCKSLTYFCNDYIFMTKSWFKVVRLTLKTKLREFDLPLPSISNEREYHSKPTLTSLFCYLKHLLYNMKYITEQKQRLHVLYFLQIRIHNIPSYQLSSPWV